MNQTDLPLFQVSEGDANVEFLVGLLGGRGWLTAREILEEIQIKTGEKFCDRKIRAIAGASEGRIAGGQLGYKLVREMTSEEYNHYRNWMKSQAAQMTDRIIRSDRVFYHHQAIS